MTQIRAALSDPYCPERELGQGGEVMLATRRSARVLAFCLLLAAPVAAQEDPVIAELDAFWAEVARTVVGGDHAGHDKSGVGRAPMIRRDREGSRRTTATARRKPRRRGPDRRILDSAVRNSIFPLWASLQRVQ